MADYSIKPVQKTIGGTIPEGKAAVQMRAWCEGGQPAPLVTELEQNRMTWRSSGYIHWVLWIIRAIFVPSKYRSEFLGELQQYKPAS